MQKLKDTNKWAHAIHQEINKIKPKISILLNITVCSFSPVQQHPSICEWRGGPVRVPDWRVGGRPSWLCASTAPAHTLQAPRHPLLPHVTRYFTRYMYSLSSSNLMYFRFKAFRKYLHSVICKWLSYVGLEHKEFAFHCPWCYYCYSMFTLF